MATTQPPAPRADSIGTGASSDSQTGSYQGVTEPQSAYRGNKTRIAFTWHGILASGRTLTTESEFLAHAPLLVQADFDYIVF